MKVIVVILGFVLFTAVSCKKTVENIKEGYVLDIMTNGQWFIESYTAGDTDKTAQFTGYTFKFNEDGTVTGTKGTVVNNGTWEGDIRTYSIISNFPGAGEPLTLLNGTWVVKDSYENYVVAEMDSAVLKLRKFE